MTLAEKIIQAKQERVVLNTQIRSIIDEFENKEMDAIKKDELSKLENAFDSKQADVIKWEKQLERDRTCGENSNMVDDPTKNKGTPDPKAEQKRLFANWLRSGGKEEYISYQNALQQDNPSQAGYLVAPQQYVAQIIEDLNNIMVIRQMSNVLPPLSGAQSLGFPKRTTRMSTFAWGTEIQAPTADTALAFGKREFKPKPGTGGILVSKTLIRNSAIDVESYIRGEMGYNFSGGQEQGYMTGDGNNKPLGIFTASPDGISTTRDVSTGNTATEIKFDGLKEAKYSIKEQYQKGLSWMFHRDGVKQIAKLKDADGQYIWQPSLVVGEPDQLLGCPVRMSEYAPNTFTSGLYVGMLGNFKMGYWICDSLTMEMQALMELYALTNQVYYIGRMETDGMPVLEECFARVKLG